MIEKIKTQDVLKRSIDWDAIIWKGIEIKKDPKLNTDMFVGNGPRRGYGRVEKTNN